MLMTDKTPMIDTTSMRRCMGKFDSVIFDSTVESYRKNFTFNALSERIARLYFVDGLFQVDIAKQVEKHRSYVNSQCKLIFAEYVRLNRKKKDEV